MSKRYLDNQNDIGKKLSLIYLFIFTLFGLFWLSSFTGPIKLVGQVLDRNGRPVPDTLVIIRVTAQSPEAMPFLGAPKEVGEMRTEIQTGANGRFEYTAKQWRIIRLGIRFENSGAYIEPALWYPDSGFRYLVMGQQYGSRESPLTFRQMPAIDAGRQP